MPGKEASKCREEKEQQYREDLRDAEIDLIKGAKDLFNELKKNNIPFTIATSADKENIELFFEKFKLNQWFDLNKCAYTDGTFKGKPNPDIYLKACEMLGVDPAKTIGVEDSVNGTISSFDAGLYTVMVVDLVPPNDITRAHTHQIYDVITRIEELFE